MPYEAYPVGTLPMEGTQSARGQIGFGWNPGSDGRGMVSLQVPTGVLGCNTVVTEVAWTALTGRVHASAGEAVANVRAAVMATRMAATLFMVSPF